MKFISRQWVGLIAVVIAIIALFTPVGGKSFGNILDTFTGDYFSATTGFILNGVTIFSSSGLKISSGSDTIARANKGFCYLNAGPVPGAIAASSTKAYDCQATDMLASAASVQAPLTGVSLGDSVQIEPASSTPATPYLGVWVNGCSASTTQGYLTCNVVNGTGASITPATTTLNLLSYLVTR